ncbi:MAG: biotin--[acetyl-CoA-carboxylase] ligase [Candidatus Accumulibacter sp.]|uniref:biotin--[acetyl-CoA-carboxylase] ligase n=1 Tax=Accumulibacter sp. TaxID=2053492 RepID=UPI0019D9C4F9|nr:biotin--[acetyl-CoA-carboxylase] ligase [Accumulibacter sp.]MBE2258076.1 biotin--[acetyl-CoA-carboxylase] ligase [Paracoccaceae bacterium]MCB1942321.1 biotin--[acetyl-CoA-carboxylase] ligase [Accumulibacter sp.]MCP5246931.1 biotin--[acetyl-CoA-carboxylase] ligase [Accumulibacter sp.]
MNDSAASCRIDPLRLQSLLGQAAGRFAVEALPECVSTSSQLLEHARQGAPAGSLLVADRQTGGRGRRGRSWLSTPEDSLTFSLLWRFDGGVARLAGLSLAVGLAVARALENCRVPGVGLKWPNDILLGGGKLGGILVDLESGTDGMLAVIGIGLNLRLPPAGDEEFLHPPAALAQVMAYLPDRHQLLAQLMIDLAAVLDRFADGGFALLRGDWQARHVWQNRPVRLLDGERVDRTGLCLGADSDGALLLQTDAGVERCFSGDVSLRLPG